MVLEGLFLNPGGLIFLAFLIPLLLLYLIKPKPKRRTIPSLMFFLTDTGKNKINKIFRNWLTDLLILFHILIILFLAGSLAEPYIMVSQELFIQDTILLIDVSASTHIADRHQQAIDAALDSLAERNTIILVQGFPEMIAESAPPARAKQLIRALKPKDTATNLADALSLATQYAGPSTNVVIISDFLPSTGGLEIEPQLNALESKGAIVTQHIIGEPTKNVGIIDLSVRDDESRVWVKNYADTPADVTIKIGDAEEQLLLAKRETKELSFATPQGVSEVRIVQEDAFMTDNTIYISTPADNQVDLLIFTNDQASYEVSNLKVALELIDKNFPITINTEYAIPPKVPDLNHDVYLFHKVNPQFVLPGYIKDLKEQVNGGAAAIFTSQNGLFSIDQLNQLLPVNYVDQGTAAEVRASQENLLTKDISFGQVQSYYKVTAEEGVTIVAQAGEDPIITLNKLGRGTVMYYGYQEGAESFSNENSYPVFWRRVLDLVTNRPTLRSLNVDTGTLLSFPKEERVKTPNGRVTTQLIRADDAGLYVLEDRTIAANLLSDLESNTNREPVTGTETETESEETEKKLPKALANITLIIGLILLAVELIYIKFRGDL